MLAREFGDAGKRVVIEERLDGEEASILAFTDGKTIVPLETAQDHKAAYDDDQGPNTGGMGAYSPAPLIGSAMMDQIVTQILVPTVHAMNRRHRPFKGVLYAGLMITNQGRRCSNTTSVLAIPRPAVLMRLKGDLGEDVDGGGARQARRRGPPGMGPASLRVRGDGRAGLSGDYPKGAAIRGLDDAAKLPDVKVFHAGTKKRGTEVVTNGGRVLGVTAIGANVSDAKLKAYQAVKLIRWDGAWCRKDISDKARKYESAQEA